MFFSSIESKPLLEETKELLHKVHVMKKQCMCGGGRGGGGGGERERERKFSVPECYTHIGCWTLLFTCYLHVIYMLFTCLREVE